MQLHLISRNGLGCGTTELHVIRSLGGVDPHYIYRYLSQPTVRQDAKDHFTGSAGQARVPVGFIEGLELPLPPVSEQRRIVEKLEFLLGRVNKSEHRLAKMPIVLKRLLQAIVDSAITGRLTQDWREERESKLTTSDQNCSDQNQTAPDEHARRVDTTEGHELITDIIPSKWSTSLLGDLFTFLDYRGRNPKKAKSGHRLITAKNIKLGYLSDGPIEFISEKEYNQWMTRGFPKVGDILFVTEGHTMGFVALNDRSDQFALAQRTLTLQPRRSVETRCMLYFMLSTPFQNIVKLNATGTAAVGVKAAKFRGLPIPTPSLAEQKEIVRRVGQLLKLVDEVETRYRTAERWLDKFGQAVMAKAFRGELVPTEAELAKAEGRTFETAEQLVKRIKKVESSRNGRRKSTMGS